MTFELKGRHVLTALLGFFGVMLAVNAALVTYALNTFSGEDVPNPYMQGLAYNQTLSAHSAQAKLGWHSTLTVERDASGALVVIVLRDSEGNPQDKLAVSVILRRPTNAALDRTITLAASGDGSYSARVADLAIGQWDVIARTIAADGTPFEATRRIVLR
jgi:nitrogen fixation protein FixH